MKNSLEQSPDSETFALGWPIAEASLTRIGESLTLRRAGSGRPHKGVDLFAPLGSPVVSVQAGKVLRVIDGTGSTRQSLQRAGWFVDILGADGRVYRYLHLAAQPSVRAGQRLAAGMQIGTVGTSGVHHARPHIHFEVRRGDYDRARNDYGEAVDPLTVLPGAELKNKGDLMAQNGMRASEKEAAAQPTAIDLETPDAQAALKFLVSKGWTPDEVRQLLDKHIPAEEPDHDSDSESARQTEAHLRSLGWSQSDIARFLVGPEQATQTAEALFRQHAANSGADQERLLQALTRAGAKAVKPDPQLLDGLDPGHLHPEAPSDLESLIAQFAQLPDVQKQRFLLLLDSQKPKQTSGAEPKEDSRPAKSAGDQNASTTSKAAGAGGDVLPVVKSSLDLLNTAIKGLLGATGAGKRTGANKSNAKSVFDADGYDEEKETDFDPDSADQNDSPYQSDPADADDAADSEPFEPEEGLPTMPEDEMSLGDEREPD